MPPHLGPHPHPGMMHPGMMHPGGMAVPMLPLHAQGVGPVQAAPQTPAVASESDDQRVFWNLPLPRKQFEYMSKRDISFVIRATSACPTRHSEA
jgi:hypothetical protein